MLETLVQSKNMDTNNIATESLEIDSTQHDDVSNVLLDSKPKNSDDPAPEISDDSPPGRLQGPENNVTEELNSETLEEISLAEETPEILKNKPDDIGDSLPDQNSKDVVTDSNSPTKKSDDEVTCPEPTKIAPDIKELVSSNEEPEITSKLQTDKLAKPAKNELIVNGIISEVTEDLSVRSRYGRTHKPKPLIEGFLTTDRKVGALLGHSPQTSPRKKEDSLRLSLKSHKKVSPNKSSPTEKLIAALESIKQMVSHASMKRSPLTSPEKVTMTPATIPKQKRGRGRPRLSAGSALKNIYTYDLPSKVKTSETNNHVEPLPKKLFTSENDTVRARSNSRNSVKNESEISPEDSKICDETLIKNDNKDDVIDVPDDTVMPLNIKKEVVEDDDEAMAEKESDSGVESSATAPPSEPEDGAQEGSKESDQADSKVALASSGEWLVGDLVWGHIKGHPFWPCIVVHEPEQGIYIKALNVGRNKMTHFHVRFFGDNARRSWIRSNQIIGFTGSEDYLELIDQHPNRKKDFEVSNRNIPKWKLAIQEAENLLDLSRAQRLEKFSDKYADVLREDMKVEDSKSESKLNESSTPKSSAKRPRKRPLTISSSPSSSEAESPMREAKDRKETPKINKYRVKRRKIKEFSPFDMFCEKHRERVEDEYPDLSNSGIEIILKQRWDTMDDSVKARYDSHPNEVEKTEVSDDDSVMDVCSEEIKVKEEKLTKSEVKKRGRKSLAKVDVTPKVRGLFKGLKLDKVCIQCEEPGGEVVKCRGSCYRFFHTKCAPENSKGTNGNEDFKCGDCVSGAMPPCCACWKEEGDGSGKDDERKRCNQQGCGRCYHEECLSLWPQAWWSRQSFTCPAHCCHTCASDDPREARMHTSQAEKLVRCIRCPATYHSGDFCLPAGCKILTGSQIICQRHYKIPKKGAYHVNTSWCFICSMGGSLICCDRCPSSFHPQCLNITAPEGSYICEDCDSARYPLYGEVVWVKLGSYRWWPARILYPSEIPENVLSLPHSLGEFAVHFFGSHNYYWVNNGRAFLYQEGDSAKRTAPKSGTDALFAKALEEASISYADHAKKKTEWEVANATGRNNSFKPPQFVRIKTNKPVGDVKPFENVHGSYTPCDCDPKTDKPCSQEPNCLNRMLMVECVPSLCRAGDRCCNQRFQKRQYPPLNTCRTEGRGWGLQTLADISQGDFVVEYVGEMINEAECHRRIERMHRLKDENYYFLTIDRDHILDAGPKGNLSRFMNHSCNPNCETQKWTVGGETRVGLFALCDIPSGTELTFNYNLQVVGTDRRPCLCGAPNCVRFIGAKNKSEPEESNGENSLQMSAKKNKANGRTPKRQEKSQKMLEDVCHKCQHGGELVYCSAKTCGKGYHTSCTEYTEESSGKWLCPLHKCFVCGSEPFSRCGECSNSFCDVHINEKVNVKRGIVCAQHVKKMSTSPEISEEDPKELSLEEQKDENLETDTPVVVKAKRGRPRGRRSSTKRLSVENES